MIEESFKIPREVIIVEGRDDTTRLIETFGPDIKVIETGGSALNRATQARIKQAAEQFGIIIFTDPDYQGLRLRRLISEAHPTAKQAHLTPEESKAKQEGASLGVEHATSSAIRAAIAAVAQLDTSVAVDRIPMSDLVRLQLIGHPEATKRRYAVAQEFHLGHLNGKQLQKQLALYQIDLETLTTFLRQYELEKHKEGQNNGN